MYVTGMSGVGFDTLVEIESSEWIFRGLGLSGFITAMDAVHMSYDTTPFTVRHLFMGKEGYPTVEHNDKTTVRFDKMVDDMRNDDLFTSCQWNTAVPSPSGEVFKLRDCMTL